MRRILATLVSLTVAAAASTASADPYRWCAEYGGGEMGSGGTNCYFMTIEQCRAAIAGMGGFCSPNQFYDGRPVVTPEDAAPRMRRNRP